MRLFQELYLFFIIFLREFVPSWFTSQPLAALLIFLAPWRLGG
jgi:hypothetical protein